MKRTMFVVQQTPAEAPPGARCWRDYGESESLILASGHAVDLQGADRIHHYRVIRREIEESVVSGPEE